MEGLQILPTVNKTVAVQPYYHHHWFFFLEQFINKHDKFFTAVCKLLLDRGMHLNLQNVWLNSFQNFEGFSCFFLGITFNVLQHFGFSISFQGSFPDNSFSTVLVYLHLLVLVSWPFICDKDSTLSCNLDAISIACELISKILFQLLLHLSTTWARRYNLTH